MNDKHINIITINKCQLQCTFCINSYLKGNVDIDMFSYDEFVKTIDRLTDFGFNSIELTPSVGDVLLDPDFMSKLTYLENNPKIKYYGFVTNLLAITPTDIYQLIYTQKCDCAISIYGHNAQTYEETTGIDAYDRFQENFSILGCKSQDYENCDPFTFYMRCSTFEELPESRLKRGMRTMMKYGAKIENGETINRNWGGLMADNTGEKTGICSRVLTENGIYPNGDVSACGCWDWNKELIIGNINEQSLEEIYSTNSKYGQLLASQFKNEYVGPCVKCDDFVKPSGYHMQHPCTKIYELFYK